MEFARGIGRWRANGLHMILILRPLKSRRDHVIKALGSRAYESGGQKDRFRTTEEYSPGASRLRDPGKGNGLGYIVPKLPQNNTKFAFTKIPEKPCMPAYRSPNVLHTSHELESALSFEFRSPERMFFNVRHNEFGPKYRFWLHGLYDLSLKGL